MTAPPLTGIRVVDTTTRWGEMAGRILAELGAVVIKIEPAAGCDSRRVGPFHEGESLYWAAMGAGKHSVVADDPEPYLSAADVFIESGYRGTLNERFPRLIHACVTPFGLGGPLADAPAAEITVEAAGGLVNLQGNGDRPPLPMGAMPQAAFHAGAQAAADIVVALNARERSGLGQHLDVSAQACIVWTLMNATGFPPNTGQNPPGTSEFRGQLPPLVAPGLKLPNIVPCRDGHAQLRLQMPVIGERTFHALLRWTEENGLDVPEALRGRDMTGWLAALAAGDIEAKDLRIAAERVVDVLALHTKREIQSFSAKHGLTLAAIYTVADLATDPQLEDRDYWVQCDGRRYAGPFARLSRTPLSRVRHAPAIGESMVSTRPATDVQSETPVDQGNVGARRQASSSSQCVSSPFEGLRVADFSWVGVGPMIGKALADHGATVVRIESASRLDLLRTSAPFKDGKRHPDRAQFMANFNTSKRGITLDLKNPEGLRLARRMADWADVVLESFSPGTMARFGLDWDALSSGRDDLIMLSTCMRGQTGRERTYSGFGGQGAAIAGLFGLVGWQDRPPSGPWGAYTDFITPRFATATLGAALLHRQRTGKGQYIDVSQIECGIRFLEPLVLEHAANGNVATRLGQGSPQLDPHGVFACRGTHRYIAVGVETDTEREALARAIGLAGPGDAGDGLDAALTAWCESRDAFAAAASLREHGVPAHVVARPADLYQDEQLAHRRFFVTLNHPVMGPTPYDGPATIYSRTPPRLRMPAPCLGQHNREVMGGVLGIDGAEYERLRTAGAFG
ncbi:MAG: CoA transferase [Gammaproteobacteria bacterium]|nr:CoA transferase [Gammaproteobacteria bacterium]